MLSLYVVAWIASIMYGFEAIIGKLISKHSIKNPWLFNFIWEFFILIGMTIAGLWFGIGIPTQWIYIILGSFMYALASAVYVLALYKLDVSVISPMFSFRTVMAVLIGALFLGEILTLHQYFLIGIIFVFGIFVSFDEHFSLKSFFNKWIIVLLVDMLFLVLMAMFIKKAVAVDGFWNSTIWIALLGQVWLLGTIKFFKKDLVQTTSKQYGYMALIAFTGIIGTLAANAAYAKNVSLAAVIISIPVSMILAFIFSIFKPELLEKHTLKIYAIRFIAATIMIIAALKL
jgi:drug/metabolite transporter (DMT)-like permease